jgi:penicillin-binding protein 2
MALILIMFLFFSLLLSRIAYLQIVKAEEYSEAVNRRSIMEIVDFTPRGNILDSKGNILATSKQTYMVTYNSIDENKDHFFNTMLRVFKILEENGETIKDDFPIVQSAEDPNKLVFQFKADTEEARQWTELRFKKDRGLDEEVVRLVAGDKKNELTEEEKREVDDKLLNISAEETFYKLLKSYKIDDEDNPQYDLKTQRSLMIVKDAVKMQSFEGYKPVVISKDIKKETALIVLQQLNDLPGIDISMQPTRYYPFNELGSAILGYISKIPSWQKEAYEERGYDVATDYIGMAGIEQAFEDRLKGSKGSRIVKINKYGRVIEELGQRESYPGQTIQLTIDKDVQAAAEKALDETMKKLQAMGKVQDVDMKNATRGAAVAIDVNTGAIIALASRPGFDPNFFSETGSLDSKLYKKYFNLDIENTAKQMGYTQEQIDKLFPIDKSIKNNTTIRQDLYDILPKPLYNYATLSIIPPGSTFKPLTAVAALETGLITPQTTFVDNGYFDDGMNFKTTFDVGAYGKVNLAKALEVSSNPFFMTLGKWLREGFGEDILAQYAWKFGLGEKSPSGIEIPERYGQVYNSKSIQELFGTQYLWSTMEMLKAGKDARGNLFPQIDLYDRESDSDKLKGIKKELKAQIQQSIKSGAFSNDIYSRLFNDLVAEDSQYKDKNISKTDIDSIIRAVNGITVYDANSQLKIGANMYNAAIGQGINSFTPLQMANFIATLVNGGNRYKLHLVDKVLSPEGKIIEEAKPEILNIVGLKQATIDAVKEGMYRVDRDDQGTANSTFKDFAIDTGGKTGSATFSNNQHDIGRTSYGWYVGFAPYDNPKIAVSVVIFDGGHGGYVAPVAKAMYEAFFKEELEKVNSGK